MLLHPCRPDGLERSHAHVQRDGSHSDAALPEPSEHAFAEVQSRSWRGDGPRLTSENGLVPAQVLLAKGIIGSGSLDVGRKWGSAEPLEHLAKVNGLKAKPPASLLGSFHKFGSNTRFKLKHLTGLEPTPSLQQPPPAPRLPLPHQETAHQPTRRPPTHQPSRYHPGVVQHQQVPAAHVIEQVMEPPMLPALLLAVEYHQPGAAPPSRRMLGDESRGQFILEVPGVHGSLSLQVRGWVRASEFNDIDKLPARPEGVP